ncbi:MAG TPA: hypothetical protein PLF11_02095 [Bacillota bacterium]|nr:hypothetical protein [Bacillota bacterium]
MGVGRSGIGDRRSEIGDGGSVVGGRWAGGVIRRWSHVIVIVIVIATSDFVEL